MSSERSSRKKNRRISFTSCRDSLSSSSSRDEEQRSKEREKKQKKRKSKKRHRTKSPTLEINRFRIVNQEDQFKQELSHTIAEYENDHPTKKRSKGVNSNDHSSSINLQEVIQMDEFMALLLKEKRQKVFLHQDAIYEKIKRKSMDVMGPLCQL